MGAARLLRFRRPRLRPRDTAVLRPGATLGERGTDPQVAAGRDDEHTSRRRTLAAGGHLRELAALIRRGADALLAAVIAPDCLACGRPIDTPLSGPICEPCWESLPVLPSAVCDRCGDPHGDTWDNAAGWKGLCPRCCRGDCRLARSRSAGAYEGALRAAIHALKYDGRRTLAPRLAQVMCQRAGAILTGADAVVPVPLHAARQRARGFNQTADLARHLGLPVVTALQRIRATPPQADLPAADRFANVMGAFEPTQRLAAWRGATLVLVDDVSTTGATLEACAGALLDGGAGQVRAITAARAVKRQR